MTGRDQIQIVAVAGALCLSLFAAPALRADATAACDPLESYDDVVVAEGVALCSTASATERLSIDSLLQAPASSEPTDPVTVDYPADQSIVPPDLVAPTFLWHDDSDADRWLVEFAFDGTDDRVVAAVAGDAPPEGEIDPRCVSEANEIYQPTPYQASAHSWRPSTAVWETVKRRSVDSPAAVTVLGYREADPERPVSRGAVTLSTSHDPVGAPIFYRDVPLMPSKTKEGVIKPLSKGAVPLVGWRLRDVAQPESRLMLSGMPTCANCHSFSADGKTLAMDIDGPEGDKGAYAIAEIQPRTEIRDEQVMTWNAFPGKPPGLNTLGFLSRISPDGRYVVSTVNEQVYVQNLKDYKFSQVFYPTRGILAWYSRATGELAALPGADDPEFVHCDPVWSPDGVTIVFARARARDPYDRRKPVARYAGDPNETRIQYDLYRMPFDEGRGGKPVPIPGASDNGMSNTFPKVSPDGKWIVFVKCSNGQLMRPDSRLWIVPFDGHGEARELHANLPVMNSWHSFSPNGRWLAFSSKSNTPYTQLFLTHIDDEGRSSPAILVENSTAANRAVNIPEFVNVDYDRFTSIVVPAVDHYEYFQRGNELARQGRFEEAVAQFEKALEGDAQEWRYNDWRIHENLSKSLMRLGDRQGALEHAEKSLERNPYNVEMHTNLGFIMAETGIYDRAMEHLDIAVKLYPSDPKTWYNRATLNLRLGNNIAALADYTEAIRLDPDYADALNGRATALRAEGDPNGALRDLDRAIELEPGLTTALWGRALIRKEQGDLAGALDDLTRAAATAPPDWPPLREIEALKARIAASLNQDG